MHMYGGVARGCMSCTCMAEWLEAGHVMYGGVARGCMSYTCMVEWLGLVITCMAQCKQLSLTIGGILYHNAYPSCGT